MFVKNYKQPRVDATTHRNYKNYFSITCYF